MRDLIEAFNVFLKYGNPYRPTDCYNDTLWVGIDPMLVSEEDLELLKQLGFDVDTYRSRFFSIRFGCR